MTLDFSPLFEEFETAFKKLIPGQSYRDWQQGGVWVEGEPTEEEAAGIIVHLTNEDLRYEEGGTYTRRDVKIYLQKPDCLEIGQEIIYRGCRYKLAEEKPYDEHADFRLYLARLITMESGEESA